MLYYAEKILHLPAANRMKVVKSGPLRVKVAFEVPIGKSSLLKQNIILTAISPQIEFETWVDWQESHSILRVLFPLTCALIMQHSRRNSVGFNARHITIPVMTWHNLRFRFSAGQIYQNPILAFPY